MTPHMKCAIYLVIMCLANVLCSWPDVDNDVSEDSDDDKKLKQALVLVDLLKNEYMRALRENRELRKIGNIETTTIGIGESTGVSTDEPNPVSGSPTSKLVTSMLRKPLSSPTTTETSKPTKVKQTSPKKVSPFRTHAPAQSAPTRVNRRMGGAKLHSFPELNRRRIPGKDYHRASASGGFVPYRRHQARRQMSTTSSQDVQISKRPEDTTDKLEPESIHVDDSEQDHATKDDMVSTEAVAKTTTRQAHVATATDVQAQVASELLSEIKLKEKISKKYLALIKPTLKVHLGGSTRLPIPLPENHAFCYTNPRNPLCRTAI